MNMIFRTAKMQLKKQMKEFVRMNIIFSTICFLTVASYGNGSDLRLKEGVLFTQFYNFAVSHGRSYIYNQTDLLSRFQVYKDSVKRAKAMNSPYEEENSEAVYGINKFADFTPEEFKAKYLSGLKRSSTSLKFRSKYQSPGRFRPPVNIDSLPKSVDWRKKSVLTPVFDQGDCGACWAFSVTATIEAMSVIENHTKSANHLSAQEFIDCDGGNKGCTGGDICQAAIWAHTHGIVSDRTYPLTRTTDKCKKIPESAKAVKVTDYKCESYINNENQILDLVANHGPVAVAVDAVSWHNYVKGIIRFHCSDHVDHAVQIVGYDLTGHVPYYIVRNSWGTDFGDKGYMYIKVGDNLCGVASEVVTVSVSPEE